MDVNKETTKIAKQICEYADLSETNEYWLGTIQDNIKKLKKTVKFVDFVLIDHWKNLYVPDLKFLL